MMSRPNPPTVRGKRLAYELRTLRQARDLTLEQVASLSDLELSKLSRIETARRRVAPVELRVLLDVYGVVDEERERLLTLCRRANQRGWWQSEPIAGWFATYLVLENDATTLHAYAAELIPGLLQTEGYYRAFLETAPAVGTPREIDRRVDVRLKRQTRLTGDNPLDLWVILNEAAIRRLGATSPEVAQEQVAHIVTMTRRSNVVVQVLPFSAGLHPGMESDFANMTFSEPDAPVTYIEYREGSLVLEDPSEVRRYATMWNHLVAQSLDEATSLAHIRNATAGLDN